MAPIEFHKLVESQVTDRLLKNEIQNLLTKKMSGEETDEEPKIQLLNTFLEQKINDYSTYIKTLTTTKEPNTALLDQLFKDTIYEAWK
jgi:predicted nucleotidyltransferase